MTQFVDIIVGARPNFIKVAAVINEFQHRMKQGSDLGYRLIHTSQHYDHQMSSIFFEELHMPLPDVNLQTGNVSSSRQIAEIMARYSGVLEIRRPDMVLVSGDVNSTVACALATKKTDASIPLAHIEAGLRSRDRDMPEEVNRVITDSISDYFFTTSRSAGDNLMEENVDPSRIFFVGNTMIDTLQKNLPFFRKPEIWDELGLQPKQYIVMTLHRQANISNAATLRSLLEAISNAAGDLPIIFPVHPHTARMMKQFDISATGIYCTEPMGYLEFNYMVQHSRAVVTDSGGISEETTIMNVPCMTLRPTTERPETCNMGTNLLLGNDHHRIAGAFQRLFEGKWQKGKQPELWDGRAAGRIMDCIENILLQDKKQVAQNIFFQGANKHALKIV